MNLNSYSQKIAFNNKDTTITFTLKQSKFLLKQSYMYKEYKSLLNISEIENGISNDVINSQSVVIDKYKNVIDNQNKVIAIKDNQISLKDIELKQSKKAHQLQKFYKWCAILGGTTLSGYLSFKYITKYN